MEKTTDWFKWYPSRWSSNEWVKTLSIEEVGVYFSLLNWQMERGSIFGDPALQAVFIGHGTTPEQLGRIWKKLSSRFEKKHRYWVAESLNPNDGKWVEMTPEELAECHKDGDRYINDTLEQVRAAGERRFQAFKDRAQKGADQRALNSDLRVAESKQENPHAASVVKLITTHYPRRKNRLGWQEGIEQAIISIDTDELLQRFEAALRAYRQECTGVEMQYVKRLDKFMSEWTGHVPDSFKAKAAAPKVEEAAPVGEKQRRQLRPGEKPPWTPGRFDSDEQKARLVAAWPPERQERWWNNEDQESN